MKIIHKRNEVEGVTTGGIIWRIFEPSKRSTLIWSLSAMGREFAHGTASTRRKAFEAMERRLAE